MRLVDADRIVYSWIIDNDGENHDGVTLQSIIDKMPTVDAEPVVRCKDCKYADETAMCGYVTWYNKEDDFCSRGERRNDAEIH